MKPNKPTPLLGGLSPDEFLETYWQRKPLLVRNAIPDFKGVFTRDELLELATRDDIESRMVRHDGETWSLGRGPFKPRQLRGKDAWTVLVSGTNLVSEAADRVLRDFSFIPYARLDDLMVSYASDGGGVGPHFDNYDVFLIQGFGRRRWRIGAQRDFTLIEGAPLRILKNFTPQHEWVLEPGDLLYLPPQYAHDGIAEGECMTYSVGFRAPTAQELGEAFLGHLQETLCLKGRFSDRGMKASRNPAEIPAGSIAQVATMLRSISWTDNDVRDFLGCYLSEPKTHVFFDPPERPISLTRFRTKLAKDGFKLDLRTQLLCAGRQIYLNGEIAPVPQTRELLEPIRLLASRRKLPAAGNYPLVLTEILYSWYCDGFGVPR